MTSPAPATFTVGNPTNGFFPITDPAGVHVISARSLDLANAAAAMLTGGVPLDTVRGMLDAAPVTNAPATGTVAAVPDDGYGAESLAGFVGDPTDAEAMFAKADEGTARAVAGSTAAYLADVGEEAASIEPIAIDCPRLGRSFLFVNPDDVPATDAFYISATARAAAGGTDDDKVAAFVDLGTEVLKRFMLPDEFVAFSSLARGTLADVNGRRQLVGGFRGARGTRALAEWLVERILPRYTSVPSEPAGN